MYMDGKLSNMEMGAIIVVLVGGLNWLLVGAFNFNLVHKIFSFSMTVERIIYVIVGLAALWVFSFGKRLRKA